MNIRVYIDVPSRRPGDAEYAEITASEAEVAVLKEEARIAGTTVSDILIRYLADQLESVIDSRK